MSSRIQELARGIDRTRIAEIERIIRPHIRRTPVFEIDAADFGLGSFSIVLKLEQLQYSGSFKARGAFANLLTRKIPASGVAAASGGNHGAAVAYAANKLGVPAKIFVPSISSPAKIERIRREGAELVIAGERYADALAASEAWAQSSGAMLIHAYDQVETILGQGTLGSEIEGQTAALDVVLVAVGGGGLIAGIAAWFEGKTRILAVEPEAAPTLASAFAAGKPVDAPAGGIAADSLAPRRVGELVFPIAQHFVDGVVLVPDDAIRLAQQALWDRLRIVAEPGGAAALAAVLSKQYKPAQGERVGVLISGANTTAVDFAR